MDLSKFQLGVGPMSVPIVDACLRYSAQHNYPIMIIASRNQADTYTGYAFTSGNLAKYTRNHPAYDPARVLLCRDHCGPYFSDHDRGLFLSDALERCLETAQGDIQAGFDLIHVDVSRVSETEQYTVARKLFSYVLDRKPSMMFEFGTEDNTGTGLAESLEKLQQQLEFVQQYRPNIKFAVSQTGSLTKHTQVGTFDVDANSKIAKLIHDHGLLFKEHNADYLAREQVSKRVLAGVDSINIAPQLGCIQSQLYLDYGMMFPDHFAQFRQDVLDAGYWRKWVPDHILDDDTRFVASAHYCFGSDSARRYHDFLLAQGIDFDSLLREKLFQALDEYRLGMAK